MFKQKLTYAVFTAALLSSTSVFAAGFHLTEGTITGMGRAFAGTGVMQDDISAIAYNPAGINFVKKSHVQVGGAMVDIKSRFTGTETRTITGTQAVSEEGKIEAMVPSAYFAQRLSDNAVFGFGIFAPFGLKTSYDDSSPLNVHAIETDLQIIELAPVLSYRLAGLDRKMTVGIGLAIQYSHAKLTSLAPGSAAPFWTTGGEAEMKGDNVAVGMQAGVNYDFTEKTRVGLAYRAAITHELKGKMTDPVNGMRKIAANLNLPAVVTLSGAHEHKDFTFSGSIRYTGWSRFHELLIMVKDTGQPASYTLEKWKDTWSFAGGVDYKINKYVTVRTGLGFEQTPVKDAQHRTARIPDSDRILLSFGASLSPTENLTFDLGATKIFLASSSMDETSTFGGGALTARAQGKYKEIGGLFSLIGLSAQYKF